jgi:DNA-binding MarR family transcriptional regulator
MTGDWTKEEAVGYWCGRILAATRLEIETGVSQLGLTGTGAVLLSLLRDKGSSRLVELARLLEHAHPSVLRQLDVLEKAGYVERTPHASDRRVKVVRLTRKGRRAVPRVRAILRQSHERAVAGFTGPEVERILGELRRMAVNLGCDVHPGGGQPS